MTETGTEITASDPLTGAAIEVAGADLGLLRRVSFFMNKFRRLGLIKHDGTLEVHSSLLNVVLRD